MKYWKWSRTDIKVITAFLTTKFFLIDPESEIVRYLIVLEDFIDEKTDKKPEKFKRNTKTIEQVIKEKIVSEIKKSDKFTN